jgi:hypothetical protein
MSTPSWTPPNPTGPGSGIPVGAFRRRQSFGIGGFGSAIVLRLVIAAIVIGAVAVPIFSVGSAVHKGIQSFGFGSTTGTSITPSPRPARPVSYLKPAGVRAGLARIARLAPGARLTLLRIDADTLSAIAVLPNGQAKLIHFAAGGTAVLPGSATGERPVPLSEIHPSVVGRLVADMGRRFHVPRNRIDYIVISSPQGLPAQWIVFSKAPSHPGFGASLSGANLHRL